MDDDIDEAFEDDGDGPELDVDEDELDPDEVDDPELEDDEIDPIGGDEEAIDGEDEDEDEPAPPPRRATGDDEDADDEDELDPDDVEADLDTILKDRIASGDDLEDEEEDEVEERVETEVAEGVTAKREGEFTCTTCFMIVHPRQFGRKDRLTCPVGDEDCTAIAVVRKQLG